MIDWADEAIDAATHAFLSEWFDMRAALDAAVKAQSTGPIPVGQAMAYESGREDMFDEVEALIERMYPEADDLLEAVRALKGETP
jgi:hypothetical protein